VDIGVSAEGNAMHAPNENLRLDLLQKGMYWIAETIERYSAI
jgi:acetylornithine deacetylase/succinyl-diaminopimelate desuccinylase-like protein